MIFVGFDWKHIIRVAKNNTYSIDYKPGFQVHYLKSMVSAHIYTSRLHDKHFEFVTDFAFTRVLESAESNLILDSQDLLNIWDFLGWARAYLFNFQYTVPNILVPNEFEVDS